MTIVCTLHEVHGTSQLGARWNLNKWSNNAHDPTTPHKNLWFLSEPDSQLNQNPEEKYQSIRQCLVLLPGMISQHKRQKEAQTIWVGSCSIHRVCVEKVCVRLDREAHFSGFTGSDWSINCQLRSLFVLPVLSQLGNAIFIDLALTWCCHAKQKTPLLPLIFSLDNSIMRLKEMSTTATFQCPLGNLIRCFELLLWF